MCGCVYMHGFVSVSVCLCVVCGLALKIKRVTVLKRNNGETVLWKRNCSRSVCLRVNPLSNYMCCKEDWTLYSSCGQGPMLYSYCCFMLRSTSKHYFTRESSPSALKRSKKCFLMKLLVSAIYFPLGTRNTCDTLPPSWHAGMRVSGLSGYRKWRSISLRLSVHFPFYPMKGRK